jgi:uncharacterized protein
VNSMKVQRHPEIPAERWQEIQDRLNSVVADHQVTLLVAIESGSRAWGFPSPDSDFDVRFIYIRKRDSYLKLQSPRDVIETPIDGVLDINGWDIRKALQLLLKSNAVANEWLQSPIRYRRDHSLIPALRDFAESVLDASALAYHYSHLCQRVVDQWLGDADTLPIKKYFYALRPALALRYLRLNRGQPLPMALPDLLRGVALPASVHQMITQLCDEKQKTRELGIGPRLPLLDSLIFEELEKARQLTRRPSLNPDAISKADELLLAFLEKAGS